MTIITSLDTVPDTARHAVPKGAPSARAPLTLEEVREIALACGADDAGAVALGDPRLAEDRPYIRHALPGAQTLVGLVLRMHPDDVRSPARSVANREFHRTGEEVDEVAQRVAVALSRRGHRSINPAMAFPMEMSAFPGRSWIVSHKRLAEACELGKMGLHRNVIHPRFGSFILLGAVITEARLEGRAAPLDLNPCFTCKLCVAACPVGAIEPDGTFRFSACYDHNYREFMTGFADFVETIAESKSRQALRDRLPQNEIASMWQSLSYKPNYKAAYCVAVCPAGDEVIAPFAQDRAAYLADTLKPLTDATETVYVVEGSDAEAHARRRFPHKPRRVIRSSLRPTRAETFFSSIPLTFQRGPARGWRATFHFDLEGDDGPVRHTVRIDDGALETEAGLSGTPDVVVRARGQDWIDVVTGRRHPVWLVLTRRLRVTGRLSWLGRFAKCFPR